MASKCAHCRSTDVNHLTDHYGCLRCGGTTSSTGEKRTPPTTEYVVGEQPEGHVPIAKCPCCGKGRAGDFSHGTDSFTCLLCGGTVAYDGTVLHEPTIPQTAEVQETSKRGIFDRLRSAFDRSPEDS